MKSTAGCFFCAQRAPRGVKSVIARETIQGSFLQMVLRMHCVTLQEIIKMLYLRER